MCRKKSRFSIFLSRNKKEQIAPLSYRQKEVLTLYGESMASGKRKHAHHIADLLAVDPETIRWHLKMARAKLSVSNSMAAYKKAVELDLL